MGQKEKEGKGEVGSVGDKIIANPAIPMYNKVSEIPAGVGFGELALISKTNKRAATIRAMEDSHFAVLDKVDYQQIYGKYEEKLLNMKIEFLKSVPIFKDWSRESLRRLTPFF